MHSLFLLLLFNKHALYLLQIKQYRGRPINSSTICGHILRRLLFTPAGAEWSPPRDALQSRLAHFCPVFLKKKQNGGGVSVSVTVWSLCVLLATCEDALRPRMDGWMDGPLLRVSADADCGFTCAQPPSCGVGAHFLSSWLAEESNVWVQRDRGASNRPKI